MGKIKKKKYKTGADLKKHVGVIDKDDEEYEEIFKELKILYKRWTKRYGVKGVQHAR